MRTKAATSTTRDRSLIEADRLLIEPDLSFPTYCLLRRFGIRRHLVPRSLLRNFIGPYTSLKSWPRFVGRLRRSGFTLPVVPMQYHSISFMRITSLVYLATAIASCLPSRDQAKKSTPRPLKSVTG